MDAARARGRKTHAEPSRELGVTAGHEGRRLFMSHLNKSNLVLVGSKRLHDAVDTVTRKPKNDLNAPINQRFDEHIGCSHNTPPSKAKLTCRIRDAIPKQVAHPIGKECGRKMWNYPCEWR